MSVDDAPSRNKQPSDLIEIVQTECRIIDQKYLAFENTLPGPGGVTGVLK